MKYLFHSLFIANIAVAIIGMVIQPETVAIHFNFEGQPDGWASREFAAFFSIGVIALLFILLQFPARLLFKLPPWMVNLPNKDYWLREENRPAAQAQCTQSIRSIGAVIFAFLLYTSFFALQANLSDPVRFNSTAPWIGLGCFGVYLIYWLIQLYCRFRIPDENPEL